MKEDSNRSGFLVTLLGGASVAWAALKVVSDIIGLTTIPDDASALWLKLEPILSVIDGVPWLAVGPIVVTFYIYLTLRALNFDWPTVLTAIRTRNDASNNSVQDVPSAVIISELQERVKAIEATPDQTEKFKEYTARYVGDATAKMNRLEATFDEKFDSLKEENNRGIDALFKNKKMTDATTFAAIAEIFEARKGLHLQSQLLQEIDELTEYLDSKEVPDDFIHEHQDWEQKVNDWHELLEPYILTPSASPITFDPKLLRSTSWQNWIDEIADSKLQISVKTFAIQSNKFSKVRTRYLGILTQKAHSSLHGGAGGRTHIVDRFTD